MSRVLFVLVFCDIVSWWRLGKCETFQNMTMYKCEHWQYISVKKNKIAGSACAANHLRLKKGLNIDITIVAVAGKEGGENIRTSILN